MCVKTLRFALILQQKKYKKKPKYMSTNIKVLKYQTHFQWKTTLSFAFPLLLALLIFFYPLRNISINFSITQRRLLLPPLTAPTQAIREILSLLFSPQNTHTHTYTYTLTHTPQPTSWNSFSSCFSFRISFQATKKPLNKISLYSVLWLK